MDPTAPGSLLDEIDQRQNEVLDQLDELNQRVEALLREFGGTRPRPVAEVS